MKEDNGCAASGVSGDCLVNVCGSVLLMSGW